MRPADQSKGIQQLISTLTFELLLVSVQPRLSKLENMNSNANEKIYFFSSMHVKKIDDFLPYHAQC